MIRSVFHLPKNSGNCGWGVNGTRLFGSFHWNFSGINGIPEKVVPFSRWKRPSGNLCSIYIFLVFSRSFERPGLPQLPRMELVTNGTGSSQTEILNGNFPNFFVNGKRPEETKRSALNSSRNS